MMDGQTIAEKAQYNYNNLNCKVIKLCQKRSEFLNSLESLILVKLHRSAMTLEEYELAEFIHNEIINRNNK